MVRDNGAFSVRLMDSTVRPLTFINGVIFASATALAGVLGIILFFRLVLSLDASLDQTVVHSDLPLAELLADIAIFTLLALCAGLAFWGELKLKRWRWPAQYLLAVAVGAVLIHFLATAANRQRDFLLLAVLAAALGCAWLVSRRTRLGQRLQAWLED